MSVPTNLTVHGCPVTDHLSPPFVRSTHVCTEPLSAVLGCLAWQVVVVFSDDSRWPPRSDALESSRKAALYTVDGNSPSDVTWALNHHSDPTQPPSLFLILCSTSCIINLLSKVNSHDSDYQEQGVLTYHHRWLVVADTESDIQFLERHAENITNISILTINDTTQVGLLYSVMWEPFGRRLQLSARVRHGTVTGEIFPTLKYGLNRRAFRITTKVWGAFVRKDLTKQSNALYSGFCIELLKTVATYMNFTYVIIQAPDDEWGDEVNGTWTGLIGQLAYKETDMMSAPASIQVNRERVMDGSFPFYIEETGVLYKRTPSLILKAILFIRPYKWQVWVVITVLIPMVGLFIWMLEQLVSAIHTDKYPQISLPVNIWNTYGAAFNQGTTVMSQNPVIRVIFFFWMIICVIYTATYSGNLVALLAVNVERPPFNSLEELSIQNEYKYGVQGGTAYTSIIKNSPGVYKTMWRRMEGWDKDNLPVLSTNHRVHMDFVDMGGYAYFTDLTEADSHVQTSCDLRIFQGKLFPLQFVMGFQNNSAYRREASEVIIRLSQTGMLVKWKQQFWPKQTTKCAMTSSTTGIAVGDLAGLFLVTIGLLLLAAIIFCTEMFITKQTIRDERLAAYKDNQLITSSVNQGTPTYRGQGIEITDHVKINNDDQM